MRKYDNHLLQVAGISKSFVNENGESVNVLDNISFSAIEGERIGLFGKSGCGKSTLLNIIAGFETCNCETRKDGKSIHKTTEYQAVVFQQPALFPWLNVLGNVTFPLKRKGMKKSEAEAVAKEMLEKVDLGGFEGYYPHELSGGMQQRVALARAFVMKPPLLLMDEPFAALDAQLRDQMQKLLLSLWEEYKPTVIFVTHDVEEAVRLTDKILFLGKEENAGELDDSESKGSRILETINIPLSMEDRTTSAGQAKIDKYKEEIKARLF